MWSVEGEGLYRVLFPGEIRAGLMVRHLLGKHSLPVTPFAKKRGVKRGEEIVKKLTMTTREGIEGMC